MSRSTCVLWFAAVALGGLMVFGLPGCRPSGASAQPVIPEAVAKARQNKTPIDARLVDADNAFGLQLLQSLRKQRPAKNVFISPVSVALALHMAYNGARGATQQAMSQTLQFKEIDLDTLNDGNAALLAALSASDPKIELRIANALYSCSDQKLNAEFVKRNTTYYGAELGDLSGAPDNINEWVGRQTNGKITNIVGKEDVDGVIALLINAVYFKGAWTQPFKSYETRQESFTLADHTQKPCQMMHQSGSYEYYQGDGFQAVRLPYGAGQTHLFILLPDKQTSLDAMLANLDLATWKKWAGQIHDKAGEIGLPRFRLECQADLIPSLKAQGMGIAFDAGADFTGIAPNTFLSKVLQKTYLDVDEQGTEAAAATAVGVATGGIAAETPDRFVMIADHPFACAIVDDASGALLFLGAIYDP